MASSSSPALMASSSSAAAAAVSSSSHSAMYTGEWDYDLFLCFRGGDTRRGFTSHLMAALSDKKIKAFIDTMIRKTESIDELLSILQRSALSIVVFSENFADSSWCLDEVATIAQSMVKFGHRALPVFYKVGWSAVAGDSGRYAATIDGELKASSEDNKRWRDALKAVANCAGHTSTAIPIESELIKAIVKDVQKHLIDMSPSIKSDNLVGMGSRIWEVEQLLAMDEQDETRIIGLWGMGGVGKTTLAKACYERIISSTKEDIKYHFIRNINENCEKQHGVDGMVHELYSKVLSEYNLIREDLDMTYRRTRLSRSKVFIVLDDVDTLWQLERLLLGDVFNLNKLFAAGSRIIVTTRNKKVLQNAMAKVYGIGCLNGEESIQLFSLRAFRQYRPPHNWMHLSRRATSYCNGNPLALRVLGGMLFGEDKPYWESLLSGLSLIQNPDIRDIFRRSYDKLETDEKRLFLDVACFLHGIPRSTVMAYLVTLYPSAYAKVKDLIDKSLLTCISSVDGEKIEVHDLLKEMAWNIVNEEPKLGKRTRLVDAEDIHKLLTTTEVKHWTLFFVKPFFKSIEMMVLPRWKRRKVIDMHEKGNCALEALRTSEGISLDLSKVKEMHLEANAFERMDFLTFLKFWWPKYDHPSYNMSINLPFPGLDSKILLPYGGLDSLPDGLRWLHWDGYLFKSLPWRFYPQHLVHLTIRSSPIKKCWEGSNQPELVNLLELNLSHCSNLIAIPDLSRSLKLEKLLLRGCKRLVEVPSHVQYLDRLITLDLGGCKNLERLPLKLNSKFLKNVRIDCCPKVEHCPEINSGAELMELELDWTPVRELPRAVYCLKQGGSLSLFGENITNTPVISASLECFLLSRTAVKEMDSYDRHQASSELLPKFYQLNLIGNSQLESLPKCIWNMVSYSLTINDSPLLESLPEISVPLDGCESLRSLPSTINNLASLVDLSLRNTGIKSLPSSIQELRRLYEIDLSNCKSLESLPELPPSVCRLDVSNCKSLKALPSNASKLIWTRLSFYNCPQLDRKVPDEIVANYPGNALTTSLPSVTFRMHIEEERHSYNYLRYSRSEIPEWYAFKSMNNDEDNSCLTVQLPPANCTDSEQLIKGIGFGVVWSSDDSFADLVMQCECYFGPITLGSWSNYVGYSNNREDGSSPDQVLLWLDNMLSGSHIMERKEGEVEGEAWYVKYAGHMVSFRFSAFDVLRKNIKIKIKRCGVFLVN